MAQQNRRHLTSSEKLALLKRHLVDKVPVSDLCDEHGLQPSTFYRWQQLLFERGAQAFDGQKPEAPRREQELAQKVQLLEQKLQKKDSVIAEISAEYVALKKELGEP
jgi:transposase-like protein